MALHSSLEWLWRRDALEHARADLEAAAGRKQHLERARLLYELGERAGEASKATAAEPSPAVACELFREAAYFALLASQRQIEGLPPFDELWSRTDSELVSRIGGSGEARSRLERLLFEPSFTGYAKLARSDQTDAAEVLARLARAALDAAGDAEVRVEKLLAERARRTLLPLLVLAVLVSVLRAGLADRLERYLDLAAGRPWRASSEWVKCHPAEHRCGDQQNVDMFVHTREDDSPWVEFDLGRERTISTVKVRNRSDCCEDRAMPLAIEVSKDGRSWREVARSKKQFQTWTADFAPEQARYVRARVLRKTFLHLEQFRVFE